MFSPEQREPDIYRFDMQVIHSASPFFMKNVTDPDAQLLKPAVEGTLTVLRACSKHETVKRVVLTSSTAAVMGCKRPADHVYNEADWSDETSQREREAWYALSKTTAERCGFSACKALVVDERCRAAWEFANGQSAFTFAVINPTMVVGPLLQPTVRAHDLTTRWLTVYSVEHKR